MQKLRWLMLRLLVLTATLFFSILGGIEAVIAASLGTTMFIHVAPLTSVSDAAAEKWMSVLTALLNFNRIQDPFELK